MQTDLFFHKSFLSHSMSEGHPERPERLLYTMSLLQDQGILDYDSLEIMEPTSAQPEDIHPVHSLEYLSMLKEKSQMGGGYFTLDTMANEHTYTAAMLAAGASVAGVDRQMSGASQNGFVLCRPPGHHAEYERAFGFCFINNIGVAAMRLIRKWDLSRIMIIDYDAHHGNGTQNTFYSTDRVLYVGLHQNGRTLFPGSGFVDEMGVGQGQGYTLNLPLTPQAGDPTYHLLFDEIIEPLSERYKPEFVLVSAGFDAHHRDSLTNLGMTLAGLALINERIQSIADEYSSGRSLYFLEGGYELEVLGNGILNVIQNLLGMEVTQYESMGQEPRHCTDESKELVKLVRERFGGILF
ncbi:histone deacetylase [Candidatus Thorarchaeota archaeon]|nr:MAG: histone deacetylase [Candidatus Thorarchaeota archaeon]